MIAIPIDSASLDKKSSKLFGNVDMFAIYESKEKSFEFIKNKECGNGIKTAKYLKEYGVTSITYSYMGDGPFKELNKSGVDIFYIGKEPMSLSEIVQKIQDNKFVKVDRSNASTYLDSGTATENCECGCK
ncbi:MAG: putative Fe-Mo cluster-binding NifX family protein [Sulfurimonas sp.]|jgi:predicted Fe-Mo cluster-binding NifX family protein|uniref:NifB/NifX family molybdenum-iron cluster-binding protein n=1 Tax=Sulfurimonas sp. TaxID=2022749 RepID=UPI0039E2E007